MGKALEGFASLEGEVEWIPTAAGKASRRKSRHTVVTPIGRLCIRPLRGCVFPRNRSPSQEWVVRFTVPGALYGDSAEIQWEAVSAAGGGKTPLWQDAHDF